MTDEALNALVEALRDVADHAGYVPHLHHTAATAITTLRAQLAEAQRLMRLERTIADKNADKADRAEAALAAQIEVDAGIADEYVAMRERQLADERAKASHHIDVPQIMRWQAGKVQSEVIATAIRAQPQDRTALDRYREKVLREAADELRGYGYSMAIHTILALIEKENSK